MPAMVGNEDLDVGEGNEWREAPVCNVGCVFSKWKVKARIVTETIILVLTCKCLCAANVGVLGNKARHFSQVRNCTRT